MARSVKFVTCDVFTDRRFAGNPLAVVPDARGLTPAQMQLIAREFAYSETTFVLPSETGADARIRIFTPTLELPFAGHPNVGTALMLAERGNILGKPVGSTLMLDEGVGLVKARLSGGMAYVNSPLPFTRGPEVPVTDICACLGLPPEAIDTSQAPRFGSVGHGVALVQLRDIPALESCNAADLSAWRHANARMQYAAENLSIYAYTLDPSDPGVVRTRMFAPLDGIPEDPATGSAAGALCGLIAERSGIDQKLKILQGQEMGRPSTIYVDSLTNLRGTWVTISGRALQVAEGELFL